MKLKERAIYQLPNGRELVADVTDGNKTVLYNLSASEPGQYELNADGRLLLNGRLTAWEVGDLMETGRFASPDVPNVVIEATTEDRDRLHEQNA